MEEVLLNGAKTQTVFTSSVFCNVNETAKKKVLFTVAASMKAFEELKILCRWSFYRFSLKPRGIEASCLNCSFGNSWESFKLKVFTGAAFDVLDTYLGAQDKHPSLSKQNYGVMWVWADKGSIQMHCVLLWFGGGYVTNVGDLQKKISVHCDAGLFLSICVRLTAPINTACLKYQFSSLIS